MTLKHGNSHATLIHRRNVNIYRALAAVGVGANWEEAEEHQDATMEVAVDVRSFRLGPDQLAQVRSEVSVSRASTGEREVSGGTSLNYSVASSARQGVGYSAAS